MAKETYTVHVSAELVHQHFCGLDYLQSERMMKKYKGLGWSVWKVKERNENVSKSILNHGK